ncbi:MAG: hypothetical protein WAO02_06835 [Verrucomicrobiia bacterium]
MKTILRQNNRRKSDEKTQAVKPQTANEFVGPGELDDHVCALKPNEFAQDYTRIFCHPANCVIVIEI